MYNDSMVFFKFFLFYFFLDVKQNAKINFVYGSQSIEMRNIFYESIDQ